MGLYNGSEYAIHFKYSKIFNVVYVSCLYGVGMPILFPIGLLTFFNMLICERLYLAKFVKMPPMMDDVLAKNSVAMMKFAPLLMIINGYWMLSNKQIFHNFHVYIKTDSELMKSTHLLYFSDMNHAYPMLIMCFMAAILTVFQMFFPDLLTKWGFSIKGKEILVDEDLPAFLDTVDP